MVANQDLYNEDEPIEDRKEYRRIIGSLQYLTISRPDIQFSVNELSRFMATPKAIHWTAMKKVLWYLLGTQDWGIQIKKVTNFYFSGFCDADWGSDSVDRKKQIGFLVHVGETLVFWRLRKQNTIALSF